MAPDRRKLALCALALWGLNACFRDKPTEVAGGGGVETTDGEIIAAAHMLAGVKVRLVPERFNPLSEALPESLTTITDSAGRYAFLGVPEGRYNLEAWQPRDGTKLLLRSLVIDGAGSRTLPPTWLARTGKLRLAWEGGRQGYLFIPGTTIARRILPDESEAPYLVLDSLPAGLLPPVFWSQSQADTAKARIAGPVAIQSDSTTDWSVFAAWTRHGVLHINTSATGAGTAGDVAAFPMLVRLTAAEFDFGQAAPDGRDIRFSDPDGSELPYQVERWDAASGRAEIWVLVPKVDGNSAGDVFFMHWGNAAAADSSSGPAVFGTASRFSAVLHLGETGSTAAGNYADATGSGRNGTGVALGAAATVAGAVGLGQRLNGVTQWIDVAGSFPTGRAVRSLSAWGKSAAPTAESHLVDYGSDATLATFGAWNDNGNWTIWHWGPGSDFVTSGRADTAWHHITVDYDGTTSRFYLDGVLVGSAAKNLATTAGGFTIGATFKGDGLWSGIIDEVAMSTVSRPADWIKLAYASQRPGASILRLEILE